MVQTRPPALCLSDSSRLRRRRLAPFWLGAALAIAFAVLVSRPARSQSDEFVVVVNRENPAASVARDFLSDAFLKKSTHWDGGATIQPVDQWAASPVRGAFSSTVLRRAVSAVRSYWQQRIFSGGELPPPELDSDDAVIRYVARYPGGVGYVSPGAKLGAVKVVSIQ